MDGLASISPKMAASLTQADNRPTDLQAAAEQFEALFIHQLLKQARSAKLAEDILGSEAGDTYRNARPGTRKAIVSSDGPWDCRSVSQSVWQPCKEII